MVEAAGGIEVLGKPGVPSVTTSWQRVRDAKPDIVVFAPCGFDEVRAAKEASVLAHEFDPTWQTACVNADRFFAALRRRLQMVLNNSQKFFMALKFTDHA